MGDASSEVSDGEDNATIDRDPLPLSGVVWMVRSEQDSGDRGRANADDPATADDSAVRGPTAAEGGNNTAVRRTRRLSSWLTVWVGLSPVTISKCWRDGEIVGR